MSENVVYWLLFVVGMSIGQLIVIGAEKERERRKRKLIESLLDKDAKP